MATPKNAAYKLRQHTQAPAPRWLCMVWDTFDKVTQLTTRHRDFPRGGYRRKAPKPPSRRDRHRAAVRRRSEVQP